MREDGQRRYNCVYARVQSECGRADYLSAPHKKMHRIILEFLQIISPFSFLMIPLNISLQEYTEEVVLLRLLHIIVVDLGVF